MVITRSDYIGIPDFITKRPVVVAETIMFKALQGKWLSAGDDTSNGSVLVIL